MACIRSATLNEVNFNIRQVIFNVLNEIDPDYWVDLNQVIYSTVAEWDTAYSSYLIQNKAQTVKYPFASFTRNISQATQKQFGAPFIAYNSSTLDPQTRKVEGAKIKPVRFTYDLIIFEKEMGNLEAIADILIVEGYQVQDFEYDSVALNAKNRITFQFDEPFLSMVPNKKDKQEGHGFIYALSVPIIVDTVLGYQSKLGIIEKVIIKLYVNNILEETFEYPEQ
jgi:hypothetical protein